jgi:hypothetical protein
MLKRRWFQIHLSTAIVMMFVAGVILFLNLTRHDGKFVSSGDHYWGWPYYVYVRVRRFLVMQSPDFETSVRLDALILNLIIWAGILILAALFLEVVLKAQASRRRWFEIHLVTAIVMQFAVGGLLWANLCGRFPDMPENSFLIHPTLYGWPVTGAERNYPKPVFDVGEGSVSDELSEGFSYSVTGIVSDAVVALVIVAFVSLFCEALIRRREARKP